MSNGRGVAVLLGLTLAAGCGPATQSTRAASPSPAPTLVPVSVLAVPHSKAAAQAVVDAVFQTVTLPAGALRVASAPDPWLAHGDDGSVTTTRVETKRWFTVAATPARLSAGVTAHLAPGFNCPAGGMGEVPAAEVTKGYRLVCIPGQQANPWFEVEAKVVGDHLDVLVDIEVTWVPPKTSYDVVPAGLTNARLSFTSGVEGLKNKAVTISGDGLASLRRAIDDATVAPPQAMPNSCPPGQGDATLTVSPRVAFDIDVYGCRAVTVLVDGKPETTLAYDPAPGAIAHRLLGLPHYDWPP